MGGVHDAAKDILYPYLSEYRTRDQFSEGENGSPLPISLNEDQVLQINQQSTDKTLTSLEYIKIAAMKAGCWFDRSSLSKIDELADKVLTALKCKPGNSVVFAQYLMKHYFEIGINQSNDYRCNESLVDFIADHKKRTWKHYFQSKSAQKNAIRIKLNRDIVDLYLTICQLSISDIEYKSRFMDEVDFFTTFTGKDNEISKAFDEIAQERNIRFSKSHIVLDFKKASMDFYESLPTELETFSGRGYMLVTCFFTMMTAVLLRQLKDRFILQVAGVESLGYLKLINLAVTLLFITYVFTRIEGKYFKPNTNAKDGYGRVFNFIMIPFLIFTVAFVFVILPNTSILHLGASWVAAWQALIPGLAHVAPLVANWSFTIFYLMAEMFMLLIFSTLFDKLFNANRSQITGSSKAVKNRKKGMLNFYLFAMNLGTVGAGLIPFLLPAAVSQSWSLYLIIGSMAGLLISTNVYMNGRGKSLVSPVQKGKKNAIDFVDRKTNDGKEIGVTFSDILSEMTQQSVVVDDKDSVIKIYLECIQKQLGTNDTNTSDRSEAFYEAFKRRCQYDDYYQAKEKKENIGILSALWKNHSLRIIVIQSLMNGLCINLIEAVWKGSLKALCTVNGVYNPVLYGQYYSILFIATGSLSIIFSLVKKYRGNKSTKWISESMITPALLLVTSAIVMGSIMWASSLPLVFNVSSVHVATVSVALGCFCLALTKSAKYVAFDTAKKEVEGEVARYTPEGGENGALYNKQKTNAEFINSKVSKSLGASMIMLTFGLFPSLNVLTASPIFLGVCGVALLVWVVSLVYTERRFKQQARLTPKGVFSEHTNQEPLRAKVLEEIVKGMQKSKGQYYTKSELQKLIPSDVLQSAGLWKDFSENKDDFFITAPRQKASTIFG